MPSLSAKYCEVKLPSATLLVALLAACTDSERLATGARIYAAHCAQCHGANLEGIGPVPALAGRSPSYTMRQLFDMKTGARRGPWAELMKPIVTSMSVQDLTAVTAFAASIPAPAAARPAATTAVR